MKRPSIEIPDLSQLRTHQDRSFQNLIAAIEHSKIEVAELSAAALRDVLKGVITGEGLPPPGVPISPVRSIETMRRCAPGFCGRRAAKRAPRLRDLRRICC